jgi:hypothetical protein
LRTPPVPFTRALLLGMGFLIAFPTALGVRIQLAVLIALPLAAYWVHRRIDRGPPERRRVLSPLVFFALAFVVVLGSRAALLATGTPGRFFVIDGESGSTVSAFITPLQTRLDKRFNAVRNPFVEGTARDWSQPASNARRGFQGRLVRTTRDAFEGAAAAEVRGRAGRGGTYLAVAVGDAFEAKADVRRSRLVAGALAVKSLRALSDGRIDLNVIYYDAAQRYIVDRPLSGRSARAAVGRPRPGRWYRLYGTDVVPRRAAFANLLFVVHGLHDRSPYAFRMDAALLMPRATSRTTYFSYARRQEPPGIWSHVAGRALGVSIVMLLAVFLGYVFAVGARLARRVPALRIAGLGDRRSRRLMLGFAGVGTAAYALEMWTYGGYGGYLAAFTGDPTAGLGKFYIRMVATLTTGIAVALLARRAWLGRREPWRALEATLIVLGFAIALSYWLKAVIAIPALTVLLFWYFARRRGVLALGLFALGFALLTPFVYQVRSQGGIRLGDLTDGSYWSELLVNIQSRFFHFESLMVTIPFPDREPPWQPLVDFFGDAVPRALWTSKPLSANARFTHEYLQGGLHHSSDIGVISLPGELWLVGGWLGVLVAGMAIGVLLRFAQALVARPVSQPGTVLLGVTVLTALLFANDGWGLASTAISVLVLAVGWLLSLRRLGAEPAPDAAHMVSVPAGAPARRFRRRVPAER